MDINLFRGLMTAILLFAFVGIWVWAWLPGRKKTFEDAAMLPLNSDSRPNSNVGAVQRTATEQSRSSSVAPTSSESGEAK